jgi:hypothetical protein
MRSPWKRVEKIMASEKTLGFGFTVLSTACSQWLIEAVAIADLVAKSIRYIVILCMSVLCASTYCTVLRCAP